MYAIRSYYANTSAEVFIPSTGTTFSKNGESGLKGETVEAEGIPWHFLKTEIGSGKYVFETNYVPNN